ncbi:chloroquine resistance transporter family protein [Babesia bovis T2Bo]|uniref:Chloroquine resistance transporter n=1 Tax=Babesia bovis TaxID=5865 RepID=A7AN08_BABBO|nr:chloroquine resistance transporter family protein [Babesia bovis T2Bo]EDO07942.1 chloroquine resistance transporter family protein [Babesia bovis T2Bo]|eukprot:XP_001611510.1 hypothetical protein [Babesia bovis T2Bo]
MKGRLQLSRSESVDLSKYAHTLRGVHPRELDFSDEFYGTSDDSSSPLDFGHCSSNGFWSRTFDFVLRRRLIIACFVYVVMDILTTVYYKRLMDHTGNYVMVTMESLVVYFLILFSFIYVACRHFFPEYMSRPFDPHPLFLMGAFDIVATALSAVGSVNTSGILLVMLGQVGIPLTIIACKVILGRKYHKLHYLSSFFIIAFVCLKELTIPAVSERNDIYSNLLYIIACLPDSIASALRSGQYTSDSFHLVKYQFSAMALQFVLGLPVFAFIMSKRHTQPDLGIFGSIVHDIESGLACLFLGRNTIVDGCSETGFPRCDSCEGSLQIFLIYLLCNMIIRVAYIVIMMEGTVTLVFLLGTLKVPLCSIAFSLPAISGDSATDFEFIDVVCFVGIMVSLFLYGTGTKRLENETATRFSTPLLPDREDFSRVVSIQEPME